MKNDSIPNRTLRTCKLASGAGYLIVFAFVFSAQLVDSEVAFGGEYPPDFLSFELSQKVSTVDGGYQLHEPFRNASKSLEDGSVICNAQAPIADLDFQRFVDVQATSALLSKSYLFVFSGLSPPA